MQRVLNESAGSSTERYGEFKQQVSGLHEEWRSYFLPRILAHQTMTDADFDRIPRFQYVDEVPGTVIGRIAGSMVGLLAMVLAFMGVAFAALRRYPVAG